MKFSAKNEDLRLRFGQKKKKEGEKITMHLFSAALCAPPKIDARPLAASKKKKMKHILSILILFPLLSSCQTNGNSIQKDQFSLTWKLDENEIICYEIIEEVLADSMEFNFPNVEKDNSPKESNFETFGFEPENKYLVLKHRSKDLIDIFVVTIHRINTERRYQMFTEGIDEKYLLKGIIDKYGNSQSFYLAVGQENLINQYFQLSSELLTIGDEWKIDIDITNYAANFDCTKFENRKRVILEDVKKNDTAKIKYDVREFVEGKTFGVEVKSDFKYEGKAEFSISKGRWISYETKYTFLSTGISEGNIISRISLKLIDEIPKKVNDLLKK